MLKRSAISFVLFGLSAILAASDAQGQDNVATADDYLSYVKPYFPGKWQIEVVDSDGKTLTKGTIEFQLKPGQRCAVSIAEGDDPTIISSAIHGYDPKTRSWRVLQFAGDGSMLEMRVTIDKEVLTAGKYQNVTYTHRNTLTKPDGTKEVSRWKATIVDRKLFELEQISHGPKKGSIMRFSRQP